MSSSDPRRRPLRVRLLDLLHELLDSPAGAVLGGLIYGCWAVYINLGAGWPHALRIGAAHAAMSCFLTMSGVAIMNRLFRLRREARAGAVLACLGSLVFTYSLLISVHLVIGTPRILLTLAPGLLPTLSFCVGYSLLLWRQAQGQTQARDPATTGSVSVHNNNSVEEPHDEIPTLVR
jgi:hypothetical protein